MRVRTQGSDVLAPHYYSTCRVADKNFSLSASATRSEIDDDDETGAASAGTAAGGGGAEDDEVVVGTTKGAAEEALDFLRTYDMRQYANRYVNVKTITNVALGIGGVIA